MRQAMVWVLVVVLAGLIAGCSGTPAATTAPSSTAQAAQPTIGPAAQPTAAAAATQPAAAAPAQPTMAPSTAPTAPPTGGGSMQLTSSAFEAGQNIPSKYTCDGAGPSPALAWSGVPANAASLALIVEDPDAPSGTFIHWVLFNLPPQVTSLPEGVPNQATLSNGGQQGQNGARRTGYMGPCPPSGTHRYYFRLYAVDTRLNLPASATAKDLQAALQGHILAQAELLGRYARTK